MPNAVNASIRKPIVIVPTYNEVDNIHSLVDRILAAVPTIHILFVDDNSKDGTRDVIAKMMAMYASQIHILKRSGKLGLGTAYIAGFKWALEQGYDAMIEMDADHSHNPQELTVFLKKLESHDAVVGSRYIEGGGTINWSILRKCISMFGSFYGRTILGIKIRDLTGGYNAWRRDTVLAIGPDQVKSEGYSFQIELKYRAFRAGKDIVESPIVFEERRAGQSKMSFKIVLEAMYRVWQIKNLVN